MLGNDVTSATSRDSGYLRSSLKTPSPKRLRFGDLENPSFPQRTISSDRQRSAFRSPDKQRVQSPSYGGTFRTIELDDLSENGRTVSEYTEANLAQSEAKSSRSPRSYIGEAYESFLSRSPTYDGKFNTLSLNDLKTSATIKSNNSRSASAPPVFENGSMSKPRLPHDGTETQTNNDRKYEALNKTFTRTEGEKRPYRSVTPSAPPMDQSSWQEGTDLYTTGLADIHQFKSISSPSTEQTTWHGNYGCQDNEVPSDHSGQEFRQETGNCTNDVSQAETILAGSFKDSLNSSYNTVGTHQESSIKSATNKSVFDASLEPHPAGAANTSRISSISEFNDRYPSIASALARVVSADTTPSTVGQENNTQDYIGRPQATSTPIPFPRENGKQRSSGKQGGS